MTSPAAFTFIHAVIERKGQVLDDGMVRIPCSQAELAAEWGLSRSTVQAHVRQLRHAVTSMNGHQVVNLRALDVVPGAAPPQCCCAEILAEIRTELAGIRATQRAQLDLDDVRERRDAQRPILRERRDASLAPASGLRDVRDASLAHVEPGPDPPPNGKRPGQGARSPATSSTGTGGEREGSVASPCDVGHDFDFGLGSGSESQNQHRVARASDADLRDAGVAHAPSRPAPTTTGGEWWDGVEADATTAVVEHLCALFADLVEANGSKRPTVTTRWRTECERLLRIDRRSVPEVERVMRWTHADAFERSNVLSLVKFRARFDDLRLRSLRTSKPTGTADPADAELQAYLDRKAAADGR